MFAYFILFYNSNMNLTYLNIMYFLWCQKIKYLYNDSQLKKQKKSQGLSYLQPHLYKLKLPTPVYNNNIIVNTYANTYANKYIKNKLL